MALAKFTRHDVLSEAQRQRRWLRHLIEVTGLKPTPLAKGAGLSPSTLLRALEDASASIMDGRTIAKLVAAYGIEPPGFVAPASEPTPPGLGESEAAPYSGTVTIPRESQIIERWTLQSEALAGLGYHPGDILFVDRTARPRAGDIVCAQLYDIQRDTAETVFRSYDPPYLVTRPLHSRAHRKPRIVDGENTLIVGVVIQSIRFRNSEALDANS